MFTKNRWQPYKMFVTILQSRTSFLLLNLESGRYRKYNFLM